MENVIALKKIIVNTLLLIVCLAIFPAIAHSANSGTFVYFGYHDKYRMDFDEIQFFNQYGKPIWLPFSNALSASDVNWGGLGGSPSQLPKNEPLPASIKMTWFSRAEQQLWEAEHTFDPQLIKTLNQYYYINPFEYKNKKPISFMESPHLVMYTTLNGLVTIWITGKHEKYILAQFRGKKMDMSDKKAIKKLAYYAPSLEHLNPKKFAEKHIDFRPKLPEISAAEMKRWDRYMARYPWQLAVNSPFEIKDYEGRYTNGEWYYIYANTPPKELGEQPMPKMLEFYVVDTRTNTQDRIRVTFGKTERQSAESESWEEIISAFEKIDKMPPTNGLITMYVEHTPEESELRIFLTKGEHKIELLDIKAAVLDNYDDYNPIACHEDDPELLLTEKDFSTDPKDSGAFQLKGPDNVPIYHFAYRLLREDGKYFYGITDYEGNTQRIRVVVDGKRLNLQLYENFQNVCVAKDEIPSDIDSYHPSVKQKKLFQLYDGKRY